MPLTPFQSKVAILLSINRTEDSHLAGGAGLHFKPDSIRYSIDLDYFHDSEERVASAFTEDRKLLLKNNFLCKVEMNQPGYIRCIVSKNNESTKIEWAHDSSWRFMPVQFEKEIGFILHPIDLTINKILALAGRDEPRDLLDVIHTHESILPIGAQCWAACGKDPGFNPLSLLELLKRRGRFHKEDFMRLNLTQPVNLLELKQKWLAMLQEAESFARIAPPDDLGCLYYSTIINKFIEPKKFINSKEYIKHFGRPGGIIPKIIPHPNSY